MCKQFSWNSFKNEITHKLFTSKSFKCCVAVIQIKADSVISGSNAFINFRFRFFDTRRETQFLKVYANHVLCRPYYADHPNARCILRCLRSLSIEIWKTQQHLQRPKSYSLPQWQKLNSLPPWSILNWLFSKFSNPQDHPFRAWRHPHSSTISCLRVYYNNGDCHILCAWA